MLMLAREPCNSRKLSQYAGLVDGTQARTLIRRLNEHYDEVGRAFRIEEVAGGYQLLSRRKFGKWLRRLAHVPGESRLSAPALETLAVIAYRQPVPRADIEAIRGVNCGEILRQLTAWAFDELSAQRIVLFVDVENVASRRTCELVGGALIDIVDVPPIIDLYKEGDRQKCRYRVVL